MQMQSNTFPPCSFCMIHDEKRKADFFDYLVLRMLNPFGY